MLDELAQLLMILVLLGSIGFAVGGAIEIVSRILAVARSASLVQRTRIDYSDQTWKVK